MSIVINGGSSGGGAGTDQTARDAAAAAQATADAAAVAATTTSALALKAPLASPTLTGTPAAPTAAQGTNTTQVATTAMVRSEAVLLATLASPTLTGTPAAPTAAQGTSTTQLATTAMVQSEVTLLAPKASPAFTGTPTAPTQTAANNSTRLATTAYVDAGDAAVTGIQPAYMPIFRAGGRMSTSGASGTKYFLVPNNSDISTNSLSGSTVSSYPTNWFYLDDADYAIAGKTAKLRVRFTLLTGTTMTINVAGGLYPVTLAAGAATLGTLVASTDVTITNGPANTVNQGLSSEVSFPADGLYAIGLTVSNTPNVAFVVFASLDLHYT